MNRNSFTFPALKISLLIVFIALSIDLDQAQPINFEPRTKGSIDDSRGGTSRVVLEKY